MKNPTERTDAARRGARVVVDEDRERQVLVGDERLCVGDVAGADGDHLAALGGDLVVVVTQLRDVLSAQQSAEMAEEHEHDGAVGPEVPQPARRSRRVG